MNDKFRRIKILTVYDDCLIGARGYRLYRYDIQEGTWRFDAKVDRTKHALLASIPLLKRLFRAEITKLYCLKDGTKLCIARKGIYRCESGNKLFSRCFHILRGSRPMNLCIGKNDSIYFGEYFANMDKKTVNVFCSYDKGKSWQIVYTFGEGQINHIHGLFFDPYTERTWIVTGDRENECMIANTADGFKSLEVAFRGGQEYRTCGLMFYPDYVVFATDSQYIKNKIKIFDRKSLEIKDLIEIQGAAIQGGQCGRLAFISTNVEPSDVNKDQHAYLWISKDGLKWKQYFSDRKDIWNPYLFQFGVFEFPHYEVSGDVHDFYFTGRAVRKTGGDTVKISI